jgi:hypothetical protein
MRPVDKDKEILEITREFYDGLVAAFPEVDGVPSGTIDPAELRQGGSKTSLLSSSTTIRALASAWNDLRTGHRWSKTGTRVSYLGIAAEPMTTEEITTAFWSLPPMDSGSAKVLDRYWRDHGVRSCRRTGRATGERGRRHAPTLQRRNGRETCQ